MSVFVFFIHRLWVDLFYNTTSGMLKLMWRFGRTWTFKYAITSSAFHIHVETLKAQWVVPGHQSKLAQGEPHEEWRKQTDRRVESMSLVTLQWAHRCYGRITPEPLVRDSEDIPQQMMIVNSGLQQILMRGLSILFIAIECNKVTDGEWHLNASLSFLQRSCPDR